MIATITKLPEFSVEYKKEVITPPTIQG